MIDQKPRFGDAVRLMGGHSNKYQGRYKRVLCVCSRGLLRSPTTAVVLAGEGYGFNTRSCGIDHRALIQVNSVLIQWADEVVCMEEHHAKVVRSLTADLGTFGYQSVIVLGIRDQYAYRDEELVKLIKEKYDGQKEI
jgi:predicted protein tyrosine phosphatase